MIRKLEFLAFYVLEVVASNFRVARDVLLPWRRVQPAMVDIPLDPGLTDTQVMLLANLITMTPGTLTLDVSADKRTLHIHALNVDDPEAFQRQIKDDFENRIRRIL